MADLLGIGLTGLRTSRNNITVTGHNISNIDTPGYSRQRAVQVTNPALATGAGYMGAGARTQTIERIIDQYTIHQVRVDTSRLKDNEAYLRNASELDNLLSNESSALGNALNGFFEGIQSAANDPLSKPARQLVFSQIESVSQRFKAAQARLTDQNNNLNTQLRTYAAKINELSTGIGELNKEIKIYQGTRNQPPNDLFDRRDELLRELSEIVDVNVQVQDGLDVHVSIGNGIPLVTGENINKLEAVPGRNDKSRYEINMVDNRGSKMHITNEIAGGEMGGVLRYRSDTLDPALNEMGRIAIVFAGEMNNQHKAGTDLNGDQGVNLFKDINTKEFQLDRITGLQRDAEAGVWIDPEQLHKLPAQEFMVKIRNGNIVLQDPVTGRDLTPKSNPNNPATGPNESFLYPDDFDSGAFNDALQAQYGFRLSNGGEYKPDPAHPDYPNDPGANNLSRTTAGIDELMNGGGLLISPTRLGASELERNPELTDTNKIALAGIAGHENNAGKASLTYKSITDAAGVPTKLDLAGAELEFIGGAYTLKLDGATLNNTSANAEELEFTNANGDIITISLNGDPANEDKWTLEGSAGGQNGSLLANLQQAKLVNANPDGSGGSSLGETYAMLVEKVGISTSESRIAAQVSLATLNQSIAMRESASGVNMDEEAGNLIRFQQAYMASTQVISAAQKLFDTLIASVGR